MEQEIIQEANHEEVCKSCGRVDVEAGYVFPLCMECRDNISKKPYPIWIKVFLVALTAVFAVALMNFPKVLEVGIAYERGLQYESEAKYASAVKQFETVTNAYPDSTETQSRLFIAHYYNEDIENAVRVFGLIAGKELDNETLLLQVNGVFDRIENLYIPSEAFVQLLDQIPSLNAEQVISKITEYSLTNPLGYYEKLILANSYYDAGKFAECKNLVEEVLKVYPDFINGHLMMAAAARETGDFEVALEHCDQALFYNAEIYEAIAAKARIELKRSNDDIALKLAEEAYRKSPDNSYNAATLALTYHFNNMTKERDELVELFETGSLKDDRNLNLLKSVISGAKQWR